MGFEPHQGFTIGDALFSRTLQRVLALLFGHIDQRYYQRQIIQAVGLGSGTVQRELEQLARAGILKRTVEGRQTYFQADRQCTIFREIHQMVRKTFGVVQALQDGLRLVAGAVDVAFIYGSVASGTEKSGSDIDLLIIGDVAVIDVVSALSDTQRDLGREVNPSVYNLPEFCRKLAAGQHFVNNVLSGPKIFVIGDEQRLKGLAEKRVAQGTSDKPRRNRRPSRNS